MKATLNKSLLMMMAACLALPVFAHSVEGNGFMSGFTHPVFGLDHLLAMLAVGALSTQIGGKAIWWVPASFVAVMLVGGVVGLNAIDLPAWLVEGGIVWSVIILGAAIAFGGKWPMPLAMLVVAFFAFFHGHAHGVEMPAQADAMYFAAGFILSTIMIHIVGVLIGLALKMVGNSDQLLRLTGAVLVGMGLHMVIG